MGSPWCRAGLHWIFPCLECAYCSCVPYGFSILPIRSATPADLISLNAFCPCSSRQASYKHKHMIVSFCASWTFSFSLKSSYAFHPLSVKDETSLKMTCEVRSLTGLQCDYMNLFILKIYASLNRTVNHPPRPKHVVSGLSCCDPCCVIMKAIWKYDSSCSCSSLNPQPWPTSSCAAFV